MTRIELMSGLCALFLIGWAAPADANCFADNCVAHGAPQPVFAPPIALQQIATASAPFSLAAGAPPQSSDSDASETLDVAAATTPGGLASLADLDGGIAEWRIIAPQSTSDQQTPGALTTIAAIQPARQTRPVPAKTEIALSPYLSVAVPVEVRLIGVPGIDQTSSTGGNRSLWFSSEGGG
jgi:hypothetical protein